MNNNISAAQNGDEHERDFHSEGAQVGENTEKVFGKNLKSWDWCHSHTCEGLTQQTFPLVPRLEEQTFSGPTLPKILTSLTFIEK